MEDNSPAPRRGGVFGSVLLCLVYWLILAPLRAPFQGAAGSVVDSVLMAAIGTAALLLFVKRFQKGKWTHVIHFRNFGVGLRAGSGLLLLTLLLALQLATGAKGAEITPQVLFATVFLCKFMTGFWEEMVFRAYLMEGYYSALSPEERTWKKRLYYALLSALIFGAVHMIGSGDPLFSMVFAGTLGFIFASAYLHSHNVLVCMLVHFVYDVFAHIPKYVTEWDEANWLLRWNAQIRLALMGVGVVMALVYIIKEPADKTK